MRNIVSIVVFCTLSAAANAAGVYVAASNVLIYNTLEPSGRLLTGVPTPFSGTCTVDGGAVSCVDIAFSNDTTPPGIFSYTDGNWSTTVGGSSVTHSQSCVESNLNNCTSSVFGLSGLWTTGLQNGGAPSGTCTASLYFSEGFCDQISITEANGVLTIIEQSGFSPSIPGSYAGYIYEFTAVPAPAGVWLLGTALGALGLIRSRAKT